MTQIAQVDVLALMQHICEHLYIQTVSDGLLESSGINFCQRL